MDKNKNIEEFDDLNNDIQNLPKDSHRFVSNSFTITSFISKRLETLKMSQKDLADNLGKNESEISKWLSGLHNLTLRTISRMEVALGVSIINPTVVFAERIEVTSQESYFGDNPVVAHESEDYSAMLSSMFADTQGEIKYNKASTDFDYQTVGV